MSFISNNYSMSGSSLRTALNVRFRNAQARKGATYRYKITAGASEDIFYTKEEVRTKQQAEK